MGYSISWLAVKGKTPEVLIQELGLAPTGKMAEYGDQLFTGRTLPSGWFLLVINQCDHRFVKPKSLAKLSNNCNAIACSIEEHVMVCTAECWRNGAKRWRIEHDAQQSIDHISTTGLLPDDYSAIEREFAEQQNHAGGKNADTDYFFEIPLLVAKSIVGFKHDEAGLEDNSFAEFQGDVSSLRSEHVSNQGDTPWWKLW